MSSCKRDGASARSARPGRCSMTGSRSQACGSTRPTIRSRCGAVSVAGTIRPARAASTTPPSGRRSRTPCGRTRTTRTPSSGCGSTAPTHGTMVAYDVRIAAPDAQILDYALLRSRAGTWAAFLSDAIAAFADLVERVNGSPGRWVVNNSWGLFDRASDAPVGSPENYSANPDHPFNQITGALVAAGADVFFAAGNCGADCPDPRCGKGDTGPGASIHGANSHPDVFTVAAVTVTDRRLGYSSQGPGALHSRKPDLAGFGHFKGSGIHPADGARRPRVRLPPESRPRCASDSPRTGWRRRSSRACCSGPLAIWGATAGTTTWVTG